MTDWTFFTPTDFVCKITTFDDGNNKHEHRVNEWQIYGSWLGKVALQNLRDPKIKIESISAWKIEQIGFSLNLPS